MPRIPLLLLALVASGAVQAATYKWTDASGQVTYSDRPPSADARPMSAASAAQPLVTGDPALPYALRAAVQRFPVTLFTTPRDCPPCDQAREHLVRRGVPFAERRLHGERDLDAMRRLGFAEPGVPAIRVGREHAAGYVGEGWDRLLDAGGYPKRSMLPADWRPAAATPLVPAAQARVEKRALTAEWLNDPANQRDDLRDTLVEPASRSVPILQAPSGRPVGGSAIRF